MTKKSFFKERTVKEIQKLNLKRIYMQRGLTETINGLDPSEDSLELRVQITPGRFFINVKNGAEASRKCYKHGELIALSHPKTQKECYESSDIPLAMRARDFDKLKEMREEDINFVGYSIQPS